MNNGYLQKADVDRYREHLVHEERSEVTIEKYIRDVQKFVMFTGDAQITKPITMAYKQHLIDCGYTSTAPEFACRNCSILRWKRFAKARS